MLETSVRPRTATRIGSRGVGDVISPSSCLRVGRGAVSSCRVFRVRNTRPLPNGAPPVARLILDSAALERYMHDEGITSRAELARRMGVSASTVTRLLDGDAAPGPAVLAGFRSAFPGRNTDALTTIK